MGTMSDPVAEGFVASLARPGGNITGVVNQGEDLIPKQFELAREFVPRAKRVAFLISGDPALERRNRGFRSVAEDSARRLGVEVVMVVASNRADIEAIQTPLARVKAEVLVVALDPVFHGFRTLLIEAVAKLKLPAIYPLPAFSESGGLLSYGFNLRDSFRRAAAFTDKILKGAKPGDLPVERPLKFELAVNLKTAKALGIKIPPSILLRADRVIE
jgi:putative ABC transport system substrate-binding protein